MISNKVYFRFQCYLYNALVFLGIGLLGVHYFTGWLDGFSDTRVLSVAILLVLVPLLLNFVYPVLLLEIEPEANTSHTRLYVPPSGYLLRPAAGEGVKSIQVPNDAVTLREQILFGVPIRCKLQIALPEEGGAQLLSPWIDYSWLSEADRQTLRELYRKM